MPCGAATVAVAEGVRELSENGGFELLYYEFEGRRVQLHDVAAAGDGGVWYVDQLSGCIGRFMPGEGVTVEFATGSREGTAHGLAQDDSGGLWYAATARDAIVRAPAMGEPRSFPLPAGLGAPHSFAAAGGTAWFTADSAVAAADAGTGRVRTFPVPGHAPYDIVIANTAVWISFPEAGALGRLDAARGELTLIELRELAASAGDGAVRLPTTDIHPLRLSAQDDVVVWFTDWRGSRIGRFDFTSRSLTLHATRSENAFPRSILVVRNILWYYEEGSGTLVRIDTTTGESDAVASPVFARHMVFDPHSGHVWLAGGNGLAYVRPR